jgi:hypothetical protein
MALTSPTVTMSSPTNPSVFGVPVQLTILVQGVAGFPTPTGTVTVADSLLGGTPLCVANLAFVSTGLARTFCTLPANAAAGEHVLTAIYNGDVVYKATISDVLRQGVQPSYTVNARSNGGGTINPAQYTLVARGDSVQFQVAENAGFHVVSVVGDNCSGVLVPIFAGGNVYRFTTNGMQFNCNIVATFSNTYAVSFSAGSGGRISPSTVQNIPAGGNVSATITPDFGFRLTNVTGCGLIFFGGPAITGPSTYTTGAINANCTISASFTALPTFTVTASAGSGGSISPTSRTVPQGATGSFVVSASSGFEIASVSGCGGSLSGITFTTGAITAACTVFASFRVAPVVPPVITTTPMIEYLHPALNYYFITSRAEDIALLDRTPPFVRTGQSFLVYPNAVAGTQPITRFYFDKVAAAGSRGSHFYTLVNTELTALVALNPTNAATPKMPFSEGVDSFAFLPVVEGVGGSCASGLIPVFRLFRGNARFPDDPNHRFTTSTTVYNAFVALGWDGEGVKLCVAG